MRHTSAATEAESSVRGGLVIIYAALMLAILLAALDQTIVATALPTIVGVLELTPAGGAAADRLFAAGREGLERLLSGWSPEQHADLARMLDKLSRALLGESADEHLISR